jgi:uncharacterized protein YndB with AHSA1/START domain
MKPDLHFEFVADKEKNTITVKREFAADRQLVWDCHTKSELLDQWFAPKPFTTKTKSMDFREGGRWHYAMVAPDGKEYWGLTDYVKIKPVDGYTALDGFSDAKGVINPKLPRAEWVVTFSDKNKNTLVQTVVKYNSLADLETVMNMGMQEGLTATLDNLDELLLKLQ